MTREIMDFWQAIAIPGVIALLGIGFVVLIGRWQKSELQEAAQGLRTATSALPPSVVVTLSTLVTAVFVVFVWYVLSKSFGETANSSISFASVAGLVLVGIAAFIGIMSLLSFSASYLGILEKLERYR